MQGIFNAGDPSEDEPLSKGRAAAAAAAAAAVAARPATTTGGRAAAAAAAASQALGAPDADLPTLLRRPRRS
jgi:hypothetical protein